MTPVYLVFGWTVACPQFRGNLCLQSLRMSVCIMHLGFDHSMFFCNLLFLKIHNVHVYSFQIENPQQTKVQIPPKSNLVNQWVFIEMTYRDLSDRTQTGVETTQTTVSTKQPQFISWEPRAHCTDCRQLSGLEMSFPGASVGLNLFQAAWLVSASSK